MSGRPAPVRTRDVKAVIKAARKEGVKQIVVTVGQASVIIPLHAPDNEGDMSPSQDSNNSFDKIMRKPEKA